ncbi:hypothetical protein ACWEVE_13130 [Staphylococcus xylosus]
MSLSLNNVMITFYFWFKSQVKEIIESFQSRVEDTVENKWVWVIVAFVVIVAVTGYAFYCTSKGYTFTGGFKLHWPRIDQMGIQCKK